MILILALLLVAVLGVFAYQSLGSRHKGFAVGSGGGGGSVRSVSAGTGVLSGMVADAVTREPIPGVRVEVQAPSGSSLTYARSGADGTFSFQLTGGEYRLELSAQGYQPCSVSSVIVQDHETVTLENTILLTELPAGQLDRLAYTSGMIIDAVSGEPVPDALLRFRENWENRNDRYVQDAQGEIVEVRTDRTGYYETTALPYGYFTAEVVKAGFATQYVNVVSCLEEQEVPPQSIVLAPETSGSDYRITLEWGAHPEDLDAHLVGEDAFHIYFAEPEAPGGAYAALDHDDVSGYGFETVTLDADPAETYHYFVYHFNGQGSLASSNAQVKVYQGNIMVARFNVPVDQGSGLYWNVFDIVDGEVVPVDEIANSSPWYDGY